MEELSPWEEIQQIAERVHSVSVQEVIRKAWEVYKPQAFAFSGFTILIFASYFFLLILLGQIGQIIGNFVLVPCLLIGFATFTKQLIDGPSNEHSGSPLFHGFQQMLSLGLVAMTKNLLFTASLAPTIMILNNAGLGEMMAEIQQSILAQEEIDWTTFSLELSLLNKIFIGLNILFAIYLIIAFIWAPLLVFFKKVPFYQGIEGSRKLISRIWWKVFGLLLTLWTIYFIASLAVSMLSSLLGPIFAFLSTIGIVAGILIVIPMSFISSYLLFDQVLDHPDNLPN